MAPLEAEIVEVGVQRLGHSQPVQGEQRGQGVFTAGADTGLDHEGALLVAVLHSRAQGHINSAI